MSEEIQYSRDDSRRAFQQGVLMAVGIAFAPLALISAGMLLAGHDPDDFGSGLHYGLVALWLIYIVTADRIAGLCLWLRIPFLREADKGEIITIFAFSALLATMRLDPSMARAAMLPEWAKGFALILAGFGGLYVLYKLTSRSRRIAKARGAVRERFWVRLLAGIRGLFQGLTARLR